MNQRDTLIAGLRYASVYLYDCIRTTKNREGWWEKAQQM